MSKSWRLILAAIRLLLRRLGKNKRDCALIIKSVRRSLVVPATLVAFSALAQPAAAQSGAASWYGSGARTANGERFNPNGMTAAHRSLPFGTRVEVRNVRNGRSIVVRINDRGPFVRGRIIDLARGPARALGIGGVTRVALSVVD